MLIFPIFPQIDIIIMRPWACVRALQRFKVLPHKQTSFDLCNTVSLSGRYHYPHFTEEATEAPRGSVLSHRVSG